MPHSPHTVVPFSPCAPDAASEPINLREAELPGDVCIGCRHCRPSLAPTLPAHHRLVERVDDAGSAAFPRTFSFVLADGDSEGFEDPKPGRHIRFQLAGAVVSPGTECPELIPGTAPHRAPRRASVLRALANASAPASPHRGGKQPPAPRTRRGSVAPLAPLDTYSRPVKRPSYAVMVGRNGSGSPPPGQRGRASLPSITNPLRPLSFNDTAV